MMTIPPEIVEINKLLERHFGLEPNTGRVYWRVVWSDDQFEKRLTDYTDKGIRLMQPEVRELPKYRQWIPHMWVLENLMIIPEMNLKELPTTKLSYEPIFPFHDRHGNPTKPNFEACKFVIDLIAAKKGVKTTPESHPDGETTEEQLEIKKTRIDRLTQDIFGDETDVSDHLARQTGIVVPNSFTTQKEN